MTKTYNIPLLFILMLLISKEVFSYESEKVVILCILTFSITAYYNARTAIYESFLAMSAKIEEEFSTLLDLRIELQKNIRTFWQQFLSLENLLIDIYSWIKFNLKSFIIKANKNRILFNFHIVKDQLNSLVKETLVTNYLFESVYKAVVINNFYFMLNKKINANPVKLNMLNFFNKLKTERTSFSVNELVLNKLNVNKDVMINNNSYNLETLLLLNIKLSK